ncbi:MAG: amino acid permease [Croceitalea sp.]|nr:amino acid permease [Croceitalea sp.]
MATSKKQEKLGLLTSTSLIVGNVIGAGVFLMPAALAAYGGIGIIGWVIAAIGALFLAKIFSQLSILVANKSGGPYIFTRVGLGDFAGFLVAWGYWISVWTTNAAIAIAFVGALTVFFPILAENALAAVVTGLSTIWLLTWVNALGIQKSGKLQIITTVLKIVPLVVVTLGGIVFFKLDNFLPFNAGDASNLETIFMATSITLYAFVGIESATIPAANVKDPEKTIPKATMFGTLLATVIYILSTVVIMGMIPMDKLAQSPAPFADAMNIIAGEWGRDFVAAGVAISAFGALNGWILIQGQIASATAKDHLFPKIFKKENAQGTPVMALVIGSVLASLVMLMNFSEGLVDQFKFIILLSTLCCLIPYLFSAASYILLHIEAKTKKKSWFSVLGLGGFTFLFSLGAIYGIGQEAVFWGLLLLFAGIPFYIYIKWSSKKDR